MIRSQTHNLLSLLMKLVHGLLVRRWTLRKPKKVLTKIDEALIDRFQILQKNAIMLHVTNSLYTFGPYIRIVFNSLFSVLRVVVCMSLFCLHFVVVNQREMRTTT